MTDTLIGRNEHASVAFEPRCRNRHGMIKAMGKQMVRRIGSQLGRQVVRGVPGGIFGGRL